MLKITVLIDNKSLLETTKAEWGFSAYIEFESLRGLFDTGSSYSTLLYNASKLNIDLNRLDFVFISHLHGDHSGALLELIKNHKPNNVFLPSNIKYNDLLAISKYVKSARAIDVFTELFPDIFSTGTLKKTVPEQSMIIRLRSCLALILGSSHHGIIDIIRHIRIYLSTPIIVAVGGYHLSGYNRGYNVGHALYNMGVQYVFPCHCTDESAKEGIYAAYKRLTACGVGLHIEISDDCKLEYTILTKK